MSVTPAPIPAPISAPIQAAAPDIARRFGIIMASLAALVPARFHRDPRFVHLILPLWYRFTRTARRFERLMARIATNTLPKPRPPRPRRPTQSADRPESNTPRLPALPTGHLWLIRAIPYEVAAYACQLEYLLADPTTVELLAACPAAARLLRPIAHMLGINSPALKRTAPKRRPKATEPANAAATCEPIPPPPPLATHRAGETHPRPNPPDPHGPNAPWPFGYRPSAKWPAGCRRRPAPA
jgi:hypothetical protein